MPEKVTVRFSAVFLGKFFFVPRSHDFCGFLVSEVASKRRP